MSPDERLHAAKAALERRVADGGNAFPSLDEAAVRIASEEKLTFYLGIDPTGPDIHLGHAVPLLLMADLVRLGHSAVILMGDFTARIGDPTGKDAARMPLSAQQVEANLQTYAEQVKRIMGSAPFEVKRNSAWLSALTPEKLLELAGMVTVQQMIQRDMFQERLKQERPIAVSEFLYPLLQGYDSVAMQVDGEVGGNDQTFNMLLGRTLEKSLLGKDKLVLATRLLVDAGGRKMSKSEGPLIAVNDSPQEIRRKVLALDDALVPLVFKLCTDEPLDRSAELSDREPRAAKEALAVKLTTMFHGEAAAEAGNRPQRVSAGPLIEVLESMGAASSATGAKKLIQQGAVEVNGEAVTDWKYEVNIGDRIRAGKGRFAEAE